MLKLFATFLIFAVGLCARGETNRFFPIWQKEAPKIADLVLIYQGGTNRLPWTPSQFSHYVSYLDLQTAKESWLFDGFLFIEFADGRGHTYESGRNLKFAGKEEWLWLLDRHFEPGKGIPALEQACAETAKRIGSPIRKRQVIISMPEPIRNQTNWGEVNGRKLYFDRAEDRTAACEWFINTAVTKWQQLAPKELELAGFYWLHEAAYTAREILPAVSSKVHEKGLKFFWIPYWGPTGSAEWRKLGFDLAWQQPNHFFRTNVPDSRLEEACALAKQHGMGMEMEFDGRMISQPEAFLPRFDAYLKTFETQGVKGGSSIAYYEGGGGVLQLATSRNPEVRQHYARLARWIIERQSIADSLVTKTGR